MARILLADVRHSLDKLARTLSGHVLHKATTCEGAKRILQRNAIDLIVCGFNFDDSRMIDFLIDVRHNCPHHDVPFVCWQNDRSLLTEQCVDGAMKAAQVLGAQLCLTYARVRRMSDEELRRTLEQCLPPEHLMISG